LEKALQQLGSTNGAGKIVGGGKLDAKRERESYGAGYTPAAVRSYYRSIMHTYRPRVLIYDWGMCETPNSAVTGASMWSMRSFWKCASTASSTTQLHGLGAMTSPRLYENVPREAAEGCFHDTCAAHTSAAVSPAHRWRSSRTEKGYTRWRGRVASLAYVNVLYCRRDMKRDAG
jgi:hypothetical protein